MPVTFCEVKNMFGRIIARRFSTTVTKRGGFNPDDRLVPLSNMPFKAHNKYKFTLGFAVFCTSGFSLPFIVVRHHTLKKN